MISWLLGPTLVSLAGAFVVVRIFDYVFSGIADSVGAARSIVFVNTWAAITAKSGMSDITKKARFWRLKSSAVKKKLDALIKDE